MRMKLVVRLMWFAACLTAILALVFDPYSHGEVGGHAPPDLRRASVTWQVAAASAMATLLVCAAGAGLARRNAARPIVRLEAAVFVSTNLLLVIRDAGLRFTSGYEHSDRAAWLLAIGLGARFALLVMSRQRDSASDAA